MKNLKVLVSGVSIADPTIAYWLNRYGFDVTVIERSPELRLGGQNIDVKGPAKQVISLMGLEDEVSKANTTEKGIQFVNDDNDTLAAFPKDEALSMTQELEILRGDLVGMLFAKTKDTVAYRFGEHIEEVSERAEGLNVRFSSGRTERYDLLIVAEGIGSSTRDIVMPGKTDFNYLGLHTAYFTAKKEDTDTQWARWHNARKGIVFLLRPDNKGTTRVCINFRSPEDAYQDLSEEEKKKVLIERINGTGWESKRLARAISDSQDFYMERLSQVKLPLWSQGRCCLVGDAAYCVTPIGGGGTDLAITGAYILAGELHRAGSYTDAFRSYEKKLHPLVREIQRIPPGVPGLIYPTTKAGVGILNIAYRVAGSSFVKAIVRKFTAPKDKAKGHDFKLPRY